MAAVSNQLHGLLSDKNAAASFVGGPAALTGRLTHLPGNVTSTGSPLLAYLLYSSLLIPIILPLYKWVLKDYNDFLALGPGGTPSTFNGYLWVTFLKVFFARSDIYTPPTVKPYEHPAQGYLPALPRRVGNRPRVAGIAPHRQVSQKGSPEMLAALQASIHEIKAANPLLLETGISCFEQHNLALFFSPHPAQVPAPAPAHPRPVRNKSTSPLNSLSSLNSYAASCEHPATVNDKVDQGSKLDPCEHPAEIAHIHTTDSSMHLTLHPSDAALVISNGWGERHPLAGRGPWVPKGFTMVYAPRNQEEVEILTEVVRAAGWWVGGCMLQACLEKRDKDPEASSFVQEAAGIEEPSGMEEPAVAA
ncbi:hypothetical protein MMC30_006578 [Trapelia coarctata]|nr:hypothetical protein [Trapelia coarctata]